MSASDKKKLRKEQNLAAMTAKQKQEQQEAKKIKAYTLTFAIIMVLVVAIVVGVIVTPMIDGVVRRSSHSVTIGEHKLSAADLNYFYVDAVTQHQESVYNQYYSSFGEYWSMMLGFDPAQPLSEQKYNNENDKTWAQYFMDNAIQTARDSYALYDEAIAKGHKLSETDQKNMDAYFESLDLYANYYGFSNAKSYLRSSYGNGANVKSYKQYYEVCSLADSYLNQYKDDLKYKPEDFRAYEKDKFDDYSTLSYIHFTMKYDTYLGEGTKSEDGKTTTWTDAEKEAARAALKADMEKIIGSEIKDKDSFDKALQALEIYKTEEKTEDKTDSTDKNNSSSSSSSSTSTAKKPTSTEVKRAFINNITLHAEALEWLKVTDRKAGEIKAFEVYTYEKKADLPADHQHGDECGCSRTVDGYTVVLFTERDDNTDKLVNVRHILVKFQGGTKDTNGNVTYSEDEKKTAKEEAEKLLKQWQDGKANEESFGELANKESDDKDGKVTDGGLYEDIYPGQMVESFENWCFAEGRKAGDTGIVETEYGYHVMYFSSFDEMSYRDMLIENDMRIEDTEKYQKSVTEKANYQLVSLKRIDVDFNVK